MDSYKFISPEEQAILARAGVVDYNTDAAYNQLARAQRLGERQRVQRSSPWGQAFESLGDVARTVDSRLQQRQAQGVIDQGGRALEAEGMARVNMARRGYDAMDNGMQTPQTAPRFTPQQPMTLNSPSASNLFAVRGGGSPFGLALRGMGGF